MDIVESWRARTARVMNRSARLRTLDARVAALATSGPGLGDQNLLAAAEAADEWKQASPQEAARLSAEVDELEQELAKSYARGKSQLVNAMATSVAPAGWTLVPWDPAVYNFTTAVSPGQRVNDALSTAEIMRLNEAIRRSKLAVTFARDAMVRIDGGGTAANDIGPYVEYFGALDAGRIRRVRDNFAVLAMAFSPPGPEIVDLRNTKYGLTCYAACYRNDRRSTVTAAVDPNSAFRTMLRATEAQTFVPTGKPGSAPRAFAQTSSSGGLSLVGKVDMFLGRAFYQAGNYEKTSDDTVGTLVHEFAHGAVNAVDVPPVDPAGNWTHARKSDDPGNNDFGETTDNQKQASTEPTVKLLAQHRPDYAVVNADCYGKFAMKLLTMNKG